MSDEFRTCSRTGCRWPAAASLSYRYGTREVWVLDLAEEPHPALYDLCPHHADALTVMRGWTRIDERVAVPAVVEPAAPDRVRTLAPARVPAGVGARAFGAAARPEAAAGGAPAPAAPPARTPAPRVARGSDARPDASTASWPGSAAPAAGPDASTASWPGSAAPAAGPAPQVAGGRYAVLHAELPRLAAEQVEQLPSTAIRPSPVPSRELGPVVDPVLPVVPAPPPAAAFEDVGAPVGAEPEQAPLRQVEGQLAIPVAELAGGAVVVSISTRRRSTEHPAGSEAAAPSGDPGDFKP